MSMLIYVYTDYVHNNDVLLRALAQAVPGAVVKTCDAGDILGGILTPDVSLFVMPGGADLYFCEKLDGAGNKAIQAYVQGGGRYLGVCAGAYYGCAELRFAQNIKGQDICGARELGFYGGIATGPIFEYIEDSMFEKSWDGIARVLDADGREVPVMYRGGCFFDGDSDAKVLLRYADIDRTPAAAVKITVGQGQAVLIGPHLEFTSKDYAAVVYRHRNASHAYEARLVDQLAAHDAQIQSLWRDMLGEALS